MIPAQVLQSVNFKENMKNILKYLTLFYFYSHNLSTLKENLLQKSSNSSLNHFLVCAGVILVTWIIAVFLQYECTTVANVALKYNTCEKLTFIYNIMQARFLASLSWEIITVVSTFWQNLKEVFYLPWQDKYSKLKTNWHINSKIFCELSSSRT